MREQTGNSKNIHGKNMWSKRCLEFKPVHKIYTVQMNIPQIYHGDFWTGALILQHHSS